MSAQLLWKFILSFLLTLCSLFQKDHIGLCLIHRSLPSRNQTTIFFIVRELVFKIWGFLQHLHFTSEYVKYVQTLPFKMTGYAVLVCAIWIGWNFVQLLFYTAAEHLWTGYQSKHILLFRLAFAGFTEYLISDNQLLTSQSTLMWFSASLPHGCRHSLYPSDKLLAVWRTS